jgi:hypothetical protein
MWQGSVSENKARQKERKESLFLSVRLKEMIAIENQKATLNLDRLWKATSSVHVC